MTRLIFLDIDGTYLANGSVPTSASDAVRAARARGHKVLLCTGRSLAQLYPDIMEAGFDGVVASGGGMVRYGDDVLVSHVFGRDGLARAVDWLEARGIAYWLETDTGLVASANLAERLSGLPDQPYLRAPFTAMDGVERDDVRKLLFLGSETPLADVEAEFADVFDIIPGTIPALGPTMGELAVRGVHKAAGIEAVVEHLGSTQEATVGFGDGMNDLEMIEWVGVGVAMGDAADAVKAAADIVVAPAVEDGLAEGFRRLGLV